MLSPLLIILGIIAIVFATPGVFKPQKHRAAFDRFLSSEKKIRVLGFAAFILGTVLSKLTWPAETWTLLSLFIMGNVYIAVSFAMILYPKLYRRLARFFTDGTPRNWRRLCLTKVSAGIGFIIWGLQMA